MHGFYTRYEAEIGQVREALPPIPGQVGALAYVAVRWGGLDLLAGPRLFATAGPRLCAGHSADTLRRAPAEGREPAPGALLNMLAACPVEPAPAVGLGAEYRLASGRWLGRRW